MQYIDMQKQMTSIWKAMVKRTIISSYLIYLDANNLYEWARSQKLPVDGFKWKRVLVYIMKTFVKNYDEDSEKGYILEVDAHCL